MYGSIDGYGHPELTDYDVTITAGTPLVIATRLAGLTGYTLNRPYKVVVQNAPTGSSNIRYTEKSVDTPDATHGIWLPPGGVVGFSNAVGPVKLAAVSGSAVVNLLFY